MAVVVLLANRPISDVGAGRVGGGGSNLVFFGQQAYNRYREPETIVKNILYGLVRDLPIGFYETSWR